jgi:hypothetical protein
VTIILILLGASASAALAIGLALFRVEAIILASLFLALLCAALLPYHGFGELAGDGRLTESSHERQAELVNRYGL